MLPQSSVVRPRTLVAAALAASAMALTMPLASAAPAAPSAPGTKIARSATAVVSHANTLTADAKKLQKGNSASDVTRALSSYWTPARMKAAKSLDSAASRGEAERTKLRTAATAKPGGLAGQVGPAKTAKAPKAVTSPSTIRPQYWYPNLPYYYPAARTNGKVFFTRSGISYVCSGSIVNSEGKSLVWTAGHCIADGGVWDSNFVFVPSYSNGWAPYGYWSSRQLWTTYQWFYNRDFSQDNGAAVMNRNFGYRIADYLGAQGIAWNQMPNYYACAFGYPQAWPFTGQYLVEACGDTFDGGGSTIAMYSGLTGGSSGGPWLRWFDGNWGYVNGHNDFIYTNNPSYMYSPYYGNQVATLYGSVRYLTS